MPTKPLPRRIREKISVDESGCWLWIASKDRYGYGQIRWDGKLRRSHRVVYSLLVGEPGVELDHLCRVPACVNPEHLESVTHAENIQRGQAGKRNRQRWPVGRLCPHGHVMDGENLYVHYSAKWGRTNHQCRQCRRESKRRRRAAGAKD